MKNIVILGGSGGLGKQVVNLMVGKGDDIYSFSSKELDVTNILAVEDCFKDISPDVVINLAGVNFDKFVHKLKGTTDSDHINHVLNVNIHGAINVAAACLPGMRDRGYGRLIYASSALATTNVVGTAIYSSCKAFIDKFVKVVSAENISKGITCNSIQLGYMDGGLTYKLPNPTAMKESLPLNRFGTAKEILDTIEYLINTEYITGANIPLTGGI